nr:Alix-SF [Mus musculus]
MASFIWVQLKKTSEVDLAKPLVKFIQQTYPSGGEEQAQYCRAAEELSKLRRSALGRPLDKHEGALETLLRYYDQICSIEPKFPFSENQICLTFTWKDAFDKGSLFGGSVKLALASLGYEKSCVLFNCAALASQIAAEQNLDNDEGLKTAAKQYQFASGTYPGYPGYCQMPMPMGYNPYAYGQYNMPYPPVYHQSPGQAPYPGPQQLTYPFPQPPQQSYYPQQ